MQEEPATPFFLPVGAGQRYCIYQPGAGDPARAVLFVPPFGEELNRSRRMLALQARALAARGLASLRIDLHGCGDSSGDFSEARWQQWQQDLLAAADWLRDHGCRDVALLAVRLGCQLALDTAALLPQPPRRIALWQLPASGNHYLTQWLRLRSANAMLGESQAPEGPQGLRERLRQGETIEVGGYGLAPELAAAIDQVQPAAPDCPVACFDIVAPPASAPLAATVRTCAGWPDASVTAVTGPAFWSSAEIATSPALVEATCDFLVQQ